MKRIQKKYKNVNITSDPILYAVLMITEIACEKNAQARYDLAYEAIKELETIEVQITSQII